MPRINLICYGINILCKYFTVWREVYEKKRGVCTSIHLCLKYFALMASSEKQLNTVKKTPASLF